MRTFRFLKLGLLAALFASSAVLYAQDEKQQENKPRQEAPKRQEEPNRETRPQSQQDETKSPRQDEARPARPEQRDQRQEEAQPRGDMRQGQQEPDRREAGRQEQGRQEAGQRSAEQQRHARPAGRSGHIPDDRFRAQFGRSHTFVAQRPEVVNGQPQFVYGGYTFVLEDAWPQDWSDSDDYYIDYVDGDYFLYDLRHPGMRIALFVVM